MRIGICSTQCNGKTTLVEAIKANWPMYKSPEKTYRDLIQEKSLPINRDGTTESQAIIRDALFEQAKLTADEKYCVSDRTILCNLVYTMYLCDKKRIVEEDFITESIIMCRESMRRYDIIFWLPLNEDIVISDENNPNRDLDDLYRREIDVLYQTIYKGYLEGSCPFFDPQDQPAFIALEGSVGEKLATIGQYLGSDGDILSEGSILSTMEEEYDKLQLMKELEAELRK